MSSQFLRRTRPFILSANLQVVAVYHIFCLLPRAFAWPLHRKRSRRNGDVVAAGKKAFREMATIWVRRMSLKRLFVRGKTSIRARGRTSHACKTEFEVAFVLMKGVLCPVFQSALVRENVVDRGRASVWYCPQLTRMATNLPQNSHSTHRPDRQIWTTRWSARA